MKALVFLEHHNGELQKGPLGVLAKAAEVAADELGAIIVGEAAARSLAEQAGRFGARRVYLATGKELEAPLPQPRVDALEQAVRAGGYDTVLFANSVLAADLAAGLAARLGAGLNWDLIDISLDGESLVGRRLALQDSVLVEVGWRSAIRLALFRGGSFEAVPSGEGAPEVVDLEVPLQPHSSLATLVEQEIEQAEGPSLEDAEVIVAGGLGLGSAENFRLAEELAGALGGAVGATRAAVYARWYPAAAQVGQTGKTVTPKLYVALGISGATQHKVGMQNSKVIVAINKDPNAPIFEIADLGVVGDLHAIVPRLAELVRARRGT